MAYKITTNPKLLEGPLYNDFICKFLSSSSSVLLYIQSDLQKGSENHFMANSKLQAFWNHPAGPKTIHFWAPTFKWGLTIANILDSATPPEKLSYPQQSVLACSGLIWTRYGTVIIPKNWNFVSVNFALSVSAMYQLSRKIQHDLSIKNQEVAVVEEE